MSSKPLPSGTTNHITKLMKQMKNQKGILENIQIGKYRFGVSVYQIAKNNFKKPCVASSILVTLLICSCDPWWAKPNLTLFYRKIEWTRKITEPLRKHRKSTKKKRLKRLLSMLWKKKNRKSRRRSAGGNSDAWRNRTRAILRVPILCGGIWGKKSAIVSTNTS